MHISQDPTDEIRIEEAFEAQEAPRIQPMSRIRAWAGRTGRDILKVEDAKFVLVTKLSRSKPASRPRFRRFCSKIMADEAEIT